MDPWLEHPAIWKGVHDALVMKTVEVLQPALNPRGYFITTGDRVWVVEDERSIWPDHLIFHDRQGNPSTVGQRTAVADEPVRIARFEEELREIFAEIRTVASQELVTTIEFVSPANKSEPKGRRIFQQKQRELTDAGVNLVEADLLRSGAHVLSVPEGVLEALRPWEYLVNVLRRDARDYEIYPIRLRNRLPRIRVPLSAGDEDVVLDMQEVFDRAYEIGAYPARVDYRSGPTPALAPDDAAWAAELLQSRRA